ncbi:MAG TPA: 30S ribosomal protein S6 [Candidatus Paceibacterota bacterium]|nr:30S ribosomal protein S6 [Candidatus Paceibacterota bacterium]HMP19212.1 30S ribosomal protein S6 [Candidatus Paceibacterota bacterium]HMP85346.1 30S ribosomal protein S6 [Candidatus Paceibacterota bacterium]
MSEEQKTNEKKLYELSFNIVPASKEKAIAELEIIKKVLSKHKSEIVKENQLELINLAYTMIKKIGEKNHRFDQAFFGSILFHSTAKDVELIKEEIDSNKNIIRFLLIKTVNDPEHSTNKIQKEEKAEVELENSEDVDADLEESEISEKEDAPVIEENNQKEVDEAIEELIK